MIDANIEKKTGENKRLFMYIKVYYCINRTREDTKLNKSQDMPVYN